MSAAIEQALNEQENLLIGTVKEAQKFNPSSPKAQVIDDTLGEMTKKQAKMKKLIEALNRPNPKKLPVQPKTDEEKKEKAKETNKEEVKEPAKELEEKLKADGKGDFWERLDFHSRLIQVIIALYPKFGNKEMNPYYAMIGKVLNPDKVWKLKGTASQALGDFVPITNGNTENEAGLLQLGKMLMDDITINKLKNNESYKNDIKEIKTNLNSGVAKYLMKNILQEKLPKEQLDKISGEELFARTQGALVGDKDGALIAGAAFDKYEMENEVKSLLKKALGGLI